MGQIILTEAERLQGLACSAEKHIEEAAVTESAREAWAEESVASFI